jgi:AbrB family looped-hinge helix DNA binding protein
MKAKVTSKGQITLPASLWKQQGWKPGTVLEFEGSATTVMVRESKTKRDPHRVIGCLQAEGLGFSEGQFG